MKYPFYATSTNGQLKFSNNQEIQEFLHSVDGKQLRITIERATGKRTDTQNDSLHLWFEMLSQTLNEAGFTVQTILAKKMDMDWNPNFVKELLWRPAQVAILGKKSTTELAKIGDIDNVYDHLCRHLGEKFGIETPAFPFDPNKR